MSKKHRKQTIPPKRIMQTDYKDSNNTKAKFKAWLKEVKYTELVDEYQRIKIVLLGMNNPRSTIRPCEKGKENIKILRYKYNLISQALLNAVTK